MGEGEGKKTRQPIILEGVAWKRRSGFGKYSNTVGVGSSWERRRFALTPTRLHYYAEGESTTKPTASEKPRGTLAILPERATITATYPGETSQPTPYALAIKTADAISGSEGTKWKLCFDDRETQLIWLVALTDIVTKASVKEFNAKVLASEMEAKSHHGGFHRLYEEGDGRLLDLVHGALVTGGAMNKRKSLRSLRRGHAGSLSSPKKDEEGIECVHGSQMIHIMDDATFTSGEFTESTNNTSPVGAQSANAYFGDSKAKENGQLPMEKLYQALLVVLVSLVYEKCAETSSSLLWQLVNIVILCICFAPNKSTDEKKERGTRVSITESDEKRVKIATPDNTMADSTTGESTDEMSTQKSLTKSMVGAQLMKLEGVPLSDMPSQRFPSEKPRIADITDDETEMNPRPERPLTEDEMAAHLHERWAMSAPGVDLSGEWTLIADESFKLEYDAYLKQLGFSGITRKVACSLIARTTELTKQTDNGRELYLKGTNPKGAWERTLTASGYPDFETHPEKTEGEDYSHTRLQIKTADSEDVDAEAWWEDRGTRHRSWLRGGKKYGGGDFESIRYIEEGSDGNVLVCESIFHPSDESKKKAVVTWRFQRDSVAE